MFSGTREPYTACLSAITKLLHVTDVTQLKSPHRCFAQVQEERTLTESQVRIYAVKNNRKTPKKPTTH